ncbi:MAG: pantoate--beta-alanine ligase [Desulfarculus sp.]|nr:pantoate--beta-alanine ligase [Desulfarculus sp.]
MSQTPLVITNPQDMRSYSAAARAAGQRVGLVPTMGALHQGHLSLLEYTAQHTHRLVVSIFVNPLQFNQQSDLDNYPRTWERDLELCAGRGTQVVYYPGVRDMYPQGFQTTVSVAQMTQGLCGGKRPGHFDGVTTVVLKLFNAVMPHLAAFGEKDFQQLQVIRRMATDLDLGVEVVGRPTVRESDGLALSSRNVRLSVAERQQALCLWRGLNRARSLVRAGETQTPALVEAAQAEIAATPGTKIEYVEIVDSTTLEPLASLDDHRARLILAVWVGGTRLIDNMALN